MTRSKTDVFLVRLALLIGASLFFDVICFTALSSLGTNPVRIAQTISHAIDCHFFPNIPECKL